MTSHVICPFHILSGQPGLRWTPSWVRLTMDMRFLTFRVCRTAYLQLPASETNVVISTNRQNTDIARPFLFAPAMQSVQFAAANSHCRPACSTFHFTAHFDIHVNPLMPYYLVEHSETVRAELWTGGYRDDKFPHSLLRATSNDLWSCQQTKPAAPLLFETTVPGFLWPCRGVAMQMKQ